MTGQVGTTEDEIEVTPEMIEAGERVLEICLFPGGISTSQAAPVLRDVYRTMAKVDLDS